MGCVVFVSLTNDPVCKESGVADFSALSHFTGSRMDEALSAWS